MKRFFYCLSKVAKSLTAAGLICTAMAQSRLGPIARDKIAEVVALKKSLTPAQQKLQTDLMLSVKSVRFELTGTSFKDIASIPPGGADDMVAVDIKAAVNPGLLGAIAANGGTVQHSSAASHQVTALVPVKALEAIAGRADVTRIVHAGLAQTNGAYS